ncbi:MAG: EamA family transporter, partial [Alphaproteobacteria bacterium]|nr:EamA family transporter [Alphaproteobacteria bacterium]
MAQAKVLARDSVQRNSPSGSTSNNSTLGIVFMSLGIFCYACSNAFVKETAPNYPIGEILFFRSLFFFIPLSLYLLLSKGIKGTKATLKTVHMRVYVIRGFLSAISLFFIFLAFKLLPFAEASALSFSGTFFVTLLSIPLLKEHVGWHRWG